tara:strand:- start:270 stop:644 length:375 start_codon:yes stop_codon:yes gene_type:complete
MKIKEIAQKYNLGKDDFWELKRGTRSMWIITHDACEKIAYREKIEFTFPEIFRDDNNNVAMLGGAKKGNKTEWSTGEASPKNCKMPYPFSMAEKRLKDRLTLKLINAYEYGIYSDVEADAFKKD